LGVSGTWALRGALAEIGGDPADVFLYGDLWGGCLL